MKLTTREDIEAPIEHVWRAVTDFVAFEKQALRRGADVVRKDPGSGPGLGSEWDVKFEFRGKPRHVEAKLTEFEANNGMRVQGTSPGLEGDTVIELVALSPRRTRLNVALNLSARNLSGRLLIQSMKFARSTLQKRFEKRVATFGNQIAETYSQDA